MNSKSPSPQRRLKENAQTRKGIESIDITTDAIDQRNATVIATIIATGRMTVTKTKMRIDTGISDRATPRKKTVIADATDIETSVAIQIDETTT